MADDKYVDIIYNDNINDSVNSNDIDNHYNSFFCMPLNIIIVIHVISNLFKWHNTKQESTMFRTRLHNHLSVILE